MHGKVHENEAHESLALLSDTQRGEEKAGGGTQGTQTNNREKRKTKKKRKKRRERIDELRRGRRQR